MSTCFSSKFGVLRHLLIHLCLCTLLFSQPVADESLAIQKLVTGKKNPDDGAVTLALGVGSLDILANRLREEQNLNALPRYFYLIGFKYQQFSAQLSEEKKAEILAVIAARMSEIDRTIPPNPDLIRSLLYHLQGIDHPIVRRLATHYAESEHELTRVSGQLLVDSIRSPSPAAKDLRNGASGRRPTAGPVAATAKSVLKDADAMQSQPLHLLVWAVMAVMAVAAVGLLWLLLKPKVRA